MGHTVERQKIGSISHIHHTTKPRNYLLNCFPGSLPAPTPYVEVVPDGVERGVPLGARHHGRHGADQRVVDERRESLRIAEKSTQI